MKQKKKLIQKSVQEPLPLWAPQDPKQDLLEKKEKPSPEINFSVDFYV